MACGDTEKETKHMAYSGSNVPIVGALVDYVNTSLSYLSSKSLTQAEELRAVKETRVSLSATFLSVVCLLLGVVCNVKFEVVTKEDEPLANDLHLILMSKEDVLYIDDIDVARVLLCLEVSDALVITISTLLIWISSYARSPLAEYLFLPWLGVTLRGIILRQAPTAVALFYTMAVINGNVNTLFLTTFCFVLVLESRLWLEISRVVVMRWEKRDHPKLSDARDVETLWSNDDAQSLEVRNFVY